MFQHIRAAYKWWSSALDMILQQADSTKAWRDYIDPDDQTINKYKRLLNKCGIWGCLLGALNATKIARYEGAYMDLVS